MNGLRVAIVTRRFWPLAGGIEQTLAELATGLHRRGVAVTVVTAQAAADWPAHLVYRGIPVVRLPAAPGGSWRTLRYLLALGRWVRAHRDQFDLVCVSQLRQEAYAVLRALRRTTIPVLLRAEKGGGDGEACWQRKSRCGSRVRQGCQTAAAIVVPEAAIELELRALDYPADRLHRIPNGIPATACADGGRRLEARAALADANADLTVATDAPVVLAVGPLRQDRGLHGLIEAWRAVTRSYPAARLWLVGDGPEREALQNQIRDLDLQHHILLPGVFEDWSTLWQAANVYVEPSEDTGLPPPLLAAAAAGLPVVITDAGARLQLAGLHAASFLAVPPRDVRALSQALLRLLTQQPPLPALAETRAEVLQRHRLSRMVDHHLRLFRQLVPAASPPRLPPRS